MTNASFIQGECAPQPSIGKGRVLVGNLQKWVPALALAAGMGVAASAQAASFTYSFVAVTANSVVDPAIGEAQLSVDVSTARIMPGRHGAAPRRFRARRRVEPSHE